ncbi:unnamed protein product [Cuscuta campestris]|uniref:Ubiquitin-like protease family profile domain-containing protein n=1 Tax=Cuscuta campestris TaxID=132261 RepID=A0A484KE79_9ASTE|nr:unnamed protein product [Cuscuta campestris]
MASNEDAYRAGNSMVFLRRTKNASAKKGQCVGDVREAGVVDNANDGMHAVNAERALQVSGGSRSMSLATPIRRSDRLRNVKWKIERINKPMRMEIDDDSDDILDEKESDDGNNEMEGEDEGEEDGASKHEDESADAPAESDDDGETDNDAGEDDEAETEGGTGSGHCTAIEVCHIPIKSAGKKKKRVKLADMKAPYPRLKSRSSPHLITKMMKQLNDLQREEVERIGFGSILGMNILELPGRLGYWLVKNFDARRSSLVLPDGTKMHMTTCDVHSVLGLPYGGVKIENNKSNRDTDLLSDWRMKFGKCNNRITPAELADEMLGCKQGGEWFIRHFVLLVMSLLVDSTSHGYVNSLALDHLRDVGRVKRLNWSHYVLEKLIDNKMKWEKNPRKYFCGPLVLLLVFYVDRVAIFTDTVPRRFPAIKGWTGKELRERENKEVRGGGFGMGHDNRPLEKGKRILLNEVAVGHPATNGEHVGTSSGKQPTVDNAKMVLVRRFVAKSKILASTIIDMINMLQEAPREMFVDERFCKLRGLGHRLMGVDDKKDAVLDASSKWKDIHCLDDDAYWSSPEVMAFVEEVERSVEVKSKYQDFLSDVPSFSLGMTQVLGEMGTDEAYNDEDAPRSENRETDTTVDTRVCGQVAVNVVGADVGDTGERDEGMQVLDQQVGEIVVGADIVNKEKESMRIQQIVEQLYMSEGAVPDDYIAFGNFCDALDAYWTSTTPLSADLIFIPVMQLKWCYCVCVNTKGSRLEVLDLSSSCIRADDKYDEMPAMLRDMLVQFFENEGMEGRLKRLATQRPTRLKMPWREPTSIHEYGVATMRHMETYMGLGVKGWDCGLSRDDQKAFNALRLKYCACIVLAEVNEMKEENMTKAKNFAAT